MIQKLKAAEPRFALVIVLAVCLTLPVFLLLIRPNITLSIVRGASMEPTLTDRQCLLAVGSTEIHRGDIVIAQSDAFGCRIVKRVIAVPGDTISIQDDTVFLNGSPLEEPYIKEPQRTGDIQPFMLEEDMYFLMGDNRNRSGDSRSIGPLQREDIHYVIPMQHQTEVLVLYFLILFGLVAAVLAASIWSAKLLTVLCYRGKHSPGRQNGANPE